MQCEWNQLAVRKYPPKILQTKLQLPIKTLTGPGPTNCSKRVLQSLQNQIIGHLHPEICQVIIFFFVYVQNRGRLIIISDKICFVNF